MNILLLDDTKFNLENLPEEIDDLRFAILDNSNPSAVDYFFIPLIFLESFNSPALVLRIADQIIKMPLDWQILIGEPEFGDLETVPLTSINDRGFKAYQFNPLSGFRPTFLDIEIIDIYHDVTWYAPRLKNGQFLCVPIDDGEKPRCIYFVKEISRNCEIVDYKQVF
ncbi:hypothetical protein EBU94_09145 [bacterium]|jgi:hypothetical protein|nr:hypothetical protein [bacterium]